MNKGRLFLIPSPISEASPADVIPAPVLDALKAIKTYVVENTRTARRYLSSAGLKGSIDGLDFHELNEHTLPSEVEAMAGLFDGGNDVGLISEAGLPAVADPGARLVELCHKLDIEVVPLVGPSSLMLALMGSGLNGQSFAFCGYVPAKPEQRRQALKTLEKRSISARQTQIIIETPYRNEQLLADILAVCDGRTRLCIAAGLTAPDAFLKTKTVAGWKKDVPVIGKRPAVFIIQG